jgi:hypothetical protein
MTRVLVVTQSLRPDASSRSRQKTGQVLIQEGNRMKARRDSLQVWTAVASFCVLGCATTTAPKVEAPTSVLRAQVGSPCAGAPAQSEAGGNGFGRVFIQAAQVSPDDLGQPLADWLANHSVRSPSVASFVGTSGAPSSVRWTRCRDLACERAEPWELTVTPALPARTSDPLKLTFQLKRDASSEIALSAEVDTHNQQPVVVDWNSTDEGALALVVTPYLVGDDADLRRLGECRSRSTRPMSVVPPTVE